MLLPRTAWVFAWSVCSVACWGFDSCEHAVNWVAAMISATSAVCLIVCAFLVFIFQPLSFLATVLSQQFRQIHIRRIGYLGCFNVTQWCVACIVPSVDIGSPRQERFDDVHVTTQYSASQRSLAIIVRFIYIRMGVKQQFNHIFVTFIRRHMQGCPAFVALGIDISTIGHKQFHDILVPLTRRPLQGCAAILIPRIDFSLIVEQ